MRFLLVALEDDAQIDVSPEIGEYTEPLPASLPAQLRLLLDSVALGEALGRLAVIEILPAHYKAFKNAKGNVQASFNFQIEGELE